MQKLLLSIIFLVASFGTNANNLTEQNMNAKQKLKIIIGEQTFLAEIFNNQTADAFIKKLPLTLEMIELNGNEKYYNPPQDQKLPIANAVSGTIFAGDLMVWDASYNSLVLFYKTFNSPYKYVKIAHIDDPQNLASALGLSDVKVTFTLD